MAEPNQRPIWGSFCDPAWRRSFDGIHSKARRDGFPSPSAVTYARVGAEPEGRSTRGPSLLLPYSCLASCSSISPARRGCHREHRGRATIRADWSRRQPNPEKVQRGLITRRSKVQILPPPRKALIRALLWPGLVRSIRCSTGCSTGWNRWRNRGCPRRYTPPRLHTREDVLIRRHRESRRGMTEPFAHDLDRDADLQTTAWHGCGGVHMRGSPRR